MQGRSDQEIVADALKAINPPSANREVISTEIVRLIHRIRRIERKRLPSFGVMKEQLETYLKNLRATKRTFFKGSPTFLTHLDDEIVQINSLRDVVVGMVKKGSRQWDFIALVATGMAQHLISAEKATLTANGPWHRLSMLFYEAATGKRDQNRVLKYMAEIKREDQRAVWVMALLDPF